MRMQAIWNGVVPAESDETVELPFPAARKTQDHVAFWRGVEVVAANADVEGTVSR